MGSSDVRTENDGDQYRLFMKALLRDVRALEQLLQEGAIETGIRRIGAEQELFLVDQAWRPAPRSRDVLEALADDHFTTELARFNMECNLDPIVFGPKALSTLEDALNDIVTRARAVANQLGLDVVMIGILPTLTLSDLTIDNMTDNPRYHALNQALTKMRGREYEFRIRGTDELLINHDTVMPEAVNTSFQIHFQVGPDEFARFYNMAQAMTAPLLASAVNSPLLFGKRLWSETRIAVFQQAIDTRSTSHQERAARVSFGRDWIRDSALDIFREDIARFRVLLGTKVDEDPFAEMARGQPPSLKALRLHNGTVYRWNRACYGILDGKAHLRIENRALPSGPTVRDEVANAALWFGLMAGGLAHYGDITKRMDFDDAQTNFVASARQGLSALLTWPSSSGGTRLRPAKEILLKELIPLARDGLDLTRVDRDDIARNLDLIEERVKSEQTGSTWMLSSLAQMRKFGTKFERMCALTAAATERQKRGNPAHEWDLARLEESGGWKQHFQRVEQFMTTDVFTVQQEDLVDLVAAMMQWQRVHVVPVEDEQHRLVGLVSAQVLLSLIGGDLTQLRGDPTPVCDIMECDPTTVKPETPTIDAIRLMREKNIRCLPVVEHGRLVGLITERDLMHLASHLLERTMRQ